MEVGQELFLHLHEKNLVFGLKVKERYQYSGACLRRVLSSPKYG